MHRFAVVRGLSPSPPSNWTSIEIGKSWSLPIVSGAGECSMMPLLRAAQPGPPFDCSPTKRYSTAMR